MQDYLDALERVNCIPIQIPALNTLADYLMIIDNFDGLIFTGGADVAPSLYGEYAKIGLESVFEEIDAAQIYLAKLAQSSNIPTLGICKGSQIINVAFGGSLYQDIDTMIDGVNLHSQKSKSFRGTHYVNIEPDSILFELFGTKAYTNSYHHQSVKKVGEGLTVTATANDGIVECLENKSNDFFVAVQWHPEMMMLKNDIMLPLFNRFADTMKTYMSGKNND